MTSLGRSADGCATASVCIDIGALADEESHHGKVPAGSGFVERHFEAYHIGIDQSAL